ncbi:hypothetical protein M413DRAFT_194449 [Hebeloma cylindrosporum]|uniref:Aminoglycoside phosphotransferase domain-containing protein n=1 Tax=Hebeloma cylindrosporum TaxID=76867 RepID=A0A0C3BSL2_HEBCY|nr:hypothetical protein M413DRAFT_194449 [Hebeloma cylindrosporum h7]
MDEPFLPPVPRIRLTLTQKLLHALLVNLPKFCRRTVYDFCLKICRKPYPPLPIYRLPFGLVLKVGSTNGIKNEACALKLLQNFRGVNHPALFDYVPTRDPNKSYMVSTWISGDCILDVWDSLSDTDKGMVVKDLQGQCKALRHGTQTLDRVISNAAGGGVADFRVPWISDKPRTFADCREFGQEVWIGMDHDMVPARVALRPIMLPIINRSNVPVSLCHGDIAPKNMIFPGGLKDWRAGRTRICLIDWEQAGWMPVYWDALKATWMELERDTEWFEMARHIFPEDRDILDADWEWRSRSGITII